MLNPQQQQSKYLFEVNGVLVPVVGKRGPVRGPCETCGTPFRSYGAKRFCSLSCYQRSDECQARLRDNAEMALRASLAKKGLSLRPKITKQCGHCSNEITRKPSRFASDLCFCNRACLRAYLAERFDRFIANPESVALPQNYDEFLDRDDLPCPVNGCGWSGKRLSMHANIAHGIAKRDFKKMLGFNISTALWSKDSVEHQARLVADGAVLPGSGPEAAARMRGLAKARTAPRDQYRSNEAAEHAAKSRALSPTRVMPPLSDEAKANLSRKAIERWKTAAVREVACSGCGDSFLTKAQAAPTDCPPCARKKKLEINRTQPWECACPACGKAFSGTRTSARNGRKRHYDTSECGKSEAVLARRPAYLRDDK